MHRFEYHAVFCFAYLFTSVMPRAKKIKNYTVVLLAVRGLPGYRRRSIRIYYHSYYVQMRDSILLAVDVYLPKGLEPGKRYGILYLDRYVRRLPKQAGYKHSDGIGCSERTSVQIKNAGIFLPGSKPFGKYTSTPANAIAHLHIIGVISKSLILRRRIPGKPRTANRNNRCSCFIFLPRHNRM